MSLGFYASAHVAAGGAFAPDDIAGLTLWLDADDASTITETSGNVTEWADKSSQALTFSPISGNAVTGTRTINSLNALDFVGAGNSRYESDTTALLVNGTDGTFTAFAVATTDTTSGIADLISQDQSGGSRMPQYMRRNGSNFETVRIIGSVVSDGSGVTLSTGTAYLFRVSHSASGAAVEAVVDGSSNGAGSGSGTNGTLTLTVDLGRSSNGDWDGLIGEILFYNSILGSSDIASVETYLSDKWGTA